MIKNGVMRAFGTDLRQSIVRSANNRFMACFSGGLVTILLQSSTATALIVISFLKSGFLTTPIAMAAVIGADISTTLVTQFLTFDLSWLSPIFLTVGIIAYNVYERSGRERHIARAMIGVGLILLSLSLIVQISEPLRNAPLMPQLLAPLNNEPMLAIVFALLITWLLHSSMAAVLLFAVFATHHIISPNLGLHLVLGANIGTALTTFFETYKEGPLVRRISVTRLVMRVIILFACVPFLPYIEEFLQRISHDPAREMVNFHTGFNVVIAIIFLPIVGWVSVLAERFFPDKRDDTDSSAPQYLDEKALKTPVMALACAARETLRMAEIVEKMLEQTMVAFEKGNDRLIESIQMMDNKVDRLNQAIKLYLTRLSQESFDPKEADRYIQILTFSTNLEYCGDVIDKSLLDAAIKKMRNHESFSEQGFAEIKDFHQRVLDNLRLAQTIFLSEDPELAARLVENKKLVRQAESETSKQHFKRLHQRQAQTVATSALHLDIVRDLRRINSYITSVAYAILDNSEKHKKKRKKRIAPISPPPESAPKPTT